MWNDLELMDGRTKEAKLLEICYQAKFIEFNDGRAETLKGIFINQFGYWNKYY